MENADTLGARVPLASNKELSISLAHKIVESAKILLHKIRSQYLAFAEYTKRIPS